MGNRESEEGPDLGERSDENADDVTQVFRNPKTDERLKGWTGQLPDVPEPTFKRPDAPKKRGGSSGSGPSSRVVNIETAGDTRKTALASSVGVMFVAALGVGAGIGWLIDKFLLHNPPTPWGMVCGLLLGVAGGFYNLARIATKLQDD